MADYSIPELREKIPFEQLKQIIQSAGEWKESCTILPQFTELYSFKSMTNKCRNGRLQTETMQISKWKYLVVVT